MLGQATRQTDDVDVSARASRIALDALKVAAEAAGPELDPRDELPNVPCLQIVHPGIVQVPGWNAATRKWMGEPEREVWKGKKLAVTVPPAKVIVASKLLRGDDRDLEDCLWLLAAHGVAAGDVMQAIRALPSALRGRAKENLAILGMTRL